MSNSYNEDAFQFDVNKTIYFRQDHEISEMVKISLDPDIVIQSKEEYIHIRGVILLQGEYKRVLEETKDNTIETSRFVESVTELPDGYAKFQHRIPVDITVPAYRVSHLDEVSVVIQSFDYELPSTNILKITSTIDVNGISTEAVQPKAQVSDPEVLEKELEVIEELKNLPEELPLMRSEQVEETADEDEEGDQEIEFVPSPVMNTSRSETETETEIEEVEAEAEEAVEEEIEERASTQAKEHNETHFQENETQDIELPEPTKDKSLDDKETIDDPVDEREEPVFDEESDDLAEEKSSSDQEIDITLKENEEIEEEAVRDVHFLTSMFNSDQEEPYTQLRIYIVQEEDTVQSIAKRYEVSSLKLLQMNKVSSEDIVTGELLYIPETSEG